MDRNLKAHSEEHRRQELKCKRKIKKKQWRARKKALKKAANNEERRQKLLATLRNEEAESVSKSKEDRPQLKDASTQASLAYWSQPRNKHNFAQTRGREMLKAALTVSQTEKQLSKPSTSKENNKKLLTERKVSQIKELDPTLISMTEGIKKLGTGTFGTCYLAKYRGMTVAVKEYLDSGGKKTPQKLKSDAKREARVIQELADHKGLPFLFGVCTETEPVRIVLLFHGEGERNLTIYQASKCKPPLSQNIWNNIFLLTCSALQHIHDCGYVHNDLKGNNVVLEKKPTCCNADEFEYNPVIIDFGRSIEAKLAKQNSPKPVYQQLANKDSYLAPELYNGTAPPSFSSDIYSFAKMVISVSKRCQSYQVPGLINQCLKVVPEARPCLSDVKLCFEK